MSETPMPAAPPDEAEAATPAPPAEPVPPPAPMRVLKRVVIKKPLFRVVEVVRDATGRLRPEGRIWHADADVARRFGRAVAANSASHEVLIADSAGRVLEKLAVCGPDERQVLWGQWRDIPLPPAPPKTAALPPPPPLPPEPKAPPRELPTLLLPD
jgi:hypothetical protein